VSGNAAGKNYARVGTPSSSGPSDAGVTTSSRNRISIDPGAVPLTAAARAFSPAVGQTVNWFSAARKGCDQMPDGRQLPSLPGSPGCSCRIRLRFPGKSLHSRVQPIVNSRSGITLNTEVGGWHTCCLTRCRLHHVFSDPELPMTAHHFNRRK